MTLTRRSFVAGSGAALAAAVTAAPAVSAAPARGGSTAVADGVRLPALSEDGMVAMPRGFKAVRINTIGVEPLLDDCNGRVIGATPSNLDGMGAFDGPGVTRLVRNHECRANAQVPVPLAPGTVYDAGVPTGMGGDTVVEVSRKGEFVQQWVGLSGTIRNCAGGTTPWGSWLTCEEDTTKAGTQVTSSVDGSDPNHLVAFAPRLGSSALAKDLAARGEWAGPCFGAGGTLFANVQSDCTYLITGPLARHLAR